MAGLCLVTSVVIRSNLTTARRSLEVALISMPDEPFDAPNRNINRPREPIRGILQWTLEREGRRMTCELRDHGEEDRSRGAAIHEWRVHAGKRCPTLQAAELGVSGFRAFDEARGWAI
jgi:hypothetical protein